MNESDASVETRRVRPVRHRGNLASLRAVQTGAGRSFGVHGVFWMCIFGVLGATMALRREGTIRVDVISFAFHGTPFRGWRAERVFMAGESMRKTNLFVLISVIVAISRDANAEDDGIYAGVYMIYDLYAVLTPNGPLRKIVELSQEREEAIPALVYEARGGGGKVGDVGRRRRRRKVATNSSKGDDGAR